MGGVAAASHRAGSCSAICGAARRRRRRRFPGEVGAGTLLRQQRCVVASAGASHRDWRRLVAQRPRVRWRAPGCKSGGAPPRARWVPRRGDGGFFSTLRPHAAFPVNVPASRGHAAPMDAGATRGAEGGWGSQPGLRPGAGPSGRVFAPRRLTESRRGERHPRGVRAATGGAPLQDVRGGEGGSSRGRGLEAGGHHRRRGDGGRRHRP